MKEDRLSKVLASFGVAARRKCEDLIFAGKVSVNGEVILKPQHKVTASKDSIEIEGQKLTRPPQKVYYLLNKPKGYVCSHEKKRFKRLVVDLIQDKSRLFTVGRLDKDTTGLIIVTNDGSFANQVIHPRYEISKEYLVKTDLEINAQHLTTIQEGLVIDGKLIEPIKVQKVRKNTMKIEVKEGKKHEVRLLVQKARLSVLELSRIRLGNLRLGKLALGEYKKVSVQELNSIFQ